MSETLPLQRHLHDLHRRIDKRARKLRRGCDMEAVHALRLGIKELRFSFYMLQASPLAMDYKAVFRPYRKLFRAAGQVRELQLQRQLLLQTKGVPEDFLKTYSEWLDFQAFRQCRVLQDMVQPLPLPAQGDFSRSIRLAVRLCTRERASGYFAGLHQEIDRMLTPDADHTDETLHELRKKLKEYAANRKLSRSCLSYDPGALPGLPAALGGFMEHLGERHDLSVAIDHLKADICGAVWTPEQRRNGQTLLAIWQEELDVFQPHPNQ